MPLTDDAAPITTVDEHGLLIEEQRAFDHAVNTGEIKLTSQNSTRGDAREAGTQAVIGVDYDEFKPETFRAFTVNFEGKEYRFLTMRKAVEFAGENADRVMYLSSVDNFTADLRQASKNP